MKPEKFFAVLAAIIMLSTVFSFSLRASEPLVKLGLLVDRKGEQIEVKSLNFGGVKELFGSKGAIIMKIPFYTVDYIEIEGFNPVGSKVESVVHFRDGSSTRFSLHNEFFQGNSTLGTFTIEARDVSELYFPN